MAKNHSATDYVGITLYDDEPNPFLMDEDEYRKAKAEYCLKVQAEIDAHEARKKARALLRGGLSPAEA